MSVIMQINPFEFFTDTAGDALDAGYIYIGEINKDPRQYPVAIYYDAALTIPAPMPLRTSNGYVVRNGSPTFLYINGNYSIRVEDKKHRQVYYVPDFLFTGSQAAVGAGDLANFIDPTKGAGLVGWVRSQMSAKITTAGQMLSAQAVSIWEYAELAIGYSPGGDPATWDWSPALLAGLQYCAARGVELDGYNQVCNLGTTVVITSGRVRLRNITLKALPAITTTMVKLQGATANPQFTNVTFDGSHAAYSWMELQDTDDAVYDGCTFKALGNAQPTVFGLWVRNSKRCIVIANKFSDITSGGFSRAIYMNADCRGITIVGNTFSNITSSGQDGDAIVSEEFGSDAQAFIVDSNYFENVQKRYVKAGGNGWIVTNNRGKTNSAGGLFSIFSFYGSNFVLSGNNVDLTSANVDYPIELGSLPTVPLVENGIISNNVFRLKSATTGITQDFIRQSCAVKNILVSGNRVDYCRSFYTNTLNEPINNVKFIGNTTEFCYGNDFNLGDATTTGAGVLIEGHTSLAPATGFALIFGGTTVLGVSANNNNYDKSFGLSSSDVRFIEAAGNINNNIADPIGEYRNSVRWYHRSSPPTSGQHRIGDITWRKPAVEGSNGGWLCVTDGNPSPDWIPFAPSRVASAYTTTGVATSRTFDAPTVSTAALANVLGTLISDLKTAGLLK